MEERERGTVGFSPSSVHRLPCCGGHLGTETTLAEGEGPTSAKVTQEETVQARMRLFSPPLPHPQMRKAYHSSFRSSELTDDVAFKCILSPSTSLGELWFQLIQH